MKHPARLLVCGCLLLSLLPAARLMAQTTSPSDPGQPAVAASTEHPGHFGLFHSMWKHVKKIDHLLPGQHVATTSAAATPDGSHPADSIQITHVGPIEDITNTGGLSEEIVDQKCKVLIAPVGTMGSAGSLALLTGKVALNNRFHIGPHMSIATVVEEASARLNWLPAPAERDIGKALLKHNQDMILPRTGRLGRIAYAHAEQTLKDVQMAAGDTSPYHFSIYVLKESGRNASSLPGGIIELDSDLVGRDWDPTIAYFRVAHEMSHILQRHETESYQALLADSATSIASLKDIMSRDPSQFKTIFAYAHHLQSTRLDFSGGQELQADACAVRLMHKQYADPVRFTQAMTDVESSLGPVLDGAAPETKTDMVTVVQSLIHGPYERHPGTRERLANLRAMAVAP